MMLDAHKNRLDLIVEPFSPKSYKTKEKNSQNKIMKEKDILDTAQA